MLSTERSAYKVGPWLVAENLSIRRIPTIPNGWLIVPKPCANNIVYAEHGFFFFSGHLELGYMLAQGCLPDQSPVKTLDS